MSSARRSLRIPAASVALVRPSSEPMEEDEPRTTRPVRNRGQTEKLRDMANRSEEASRERTKKLAVAELARRRKEKAARSFDDADEEELEEDDYEDRQSIQISSQPIPVLAKKSTSRSMYPTSALPPQEGTRGSAATSTRHVASSSQADRDSEFSQEELNELHDDPNANEDASDHDVDQQAEALRSLTLNSGSKRKAAGDAQGPRSAKAAKADKTSQPATPKPGARQAQGPHRQVLKLGLSLYRQGISTVYGFADNDQGDDMGGQCWKKACAMKTITLEMSENDLRLLKERGSQLRIELKTKATPIIEQGYGLLRLLPEKKKKVDRLSKHVMALLDNVSFIYRDPSTRDGMYLNITVYKILGRMWFHNRRSEGIKYEEYFMPISLATIALILTVIENVLDKYKTGLWLHREFSWNNYHVRYESHLQDLEAWQVDNPEWVTRWTTHLATAARKQLGINDDDTAPTGRISARDRQEAAARLSMKDLESIGAPTGYDSDGSEGSEGDGMGDRLLDGVGDDDLGTN